MDVLRDDLCSKIICEICQKNDALVQRNGVYYCAICYMKRDRSKDNENN